MFYGRALLITPPHPPAAAAAMAAGDDVCTAGDQRRWLLPSDAD
eukprot:COSAG05_NODE_14647_length_391_cov_0.880137_1_plen_43_part_01